MGLIDQARNFANGMIKTVRILTVDNPLLHIIDRGLGAAKEGNKLIDDATKPGPMPSDRLDGSLNGSGARPSQLVNQDTASHPQQ